MSSFRTTLVFPGYVNDGPESPSTSTNSEKGKENVRLILGDQSFSFDHQKPVSIRNIKSGSLPVNTIGFALVNKNLNIAERNYLLKDLFYPDYGIGICYLRMSIRASAFSPAVYTYDMPICLEYGI